MEWLRKHSCHLLRIGLGVIFVWFGALKFFPGMSPAEGLVAKTVCWAVDPELFIPVLGGWECAMGIGLLTGKWMRLTLLSLGAHMAGTFMPLVACPEAVWIHFPYAWTLEGQYILKNIVIIAAGLALASRITVPGNPAAERLPHRLPAAGLTDSLRWRLETASRHEGGAR